MGKVYARAEKIPDETSTYLTAGKMYPVTFEDGRLFEITADNGSGICCLWTGCPHLGGNWTKVTEEVSESNPVITVPPDSVLIHQVTTALPEHSFTEPKRKVKPVCTHCGGSNIFFDAVSTWDVERQEQVMLNTFDNTDCEDCEGECSVNWIEVTE